MSTHRRKWQKSEKLAALAMYKKEGVSATRRQFQISMTRFYKWKEKFEALGESAFEDNEKSQVSTDNKYLIEEDKRLKLIIVEKELKLMIPEELLKKSPY